ncbi:hypothetical protein PS6_008180 [Mucor atramentarius]
MYGAVWLDISGILDLAEEMTINGIEFDNTATRIIRAAVHKVESEDGGYPDLQENADKKQCCNMLKELAGKWMISE